MEVGFPLKIPAHRGLRSGAEIFGAFSDVADEAQLWLSSSDWEDMKIAIAKLDRIVADEFLLARREAEKADN